MQTASIRVMKEVFAKIKSSDEVLAALAAANTTADASNTTAEAADTTAEGANTTADAADKLTVQINRAGKNMNLDYNIK